MKSFKYSDEKISGSELMFAIPSMVIGVGILALPRGVSSDTIGSDGWIVIVIAGGISMFMVWLMAKLAATFPHQSFLSYVSTLVSKPVAKVVTLLFAIFFISIMAYEVRVLGHTSEQYLFTNTPVEVVTLSFLLVVVYAVAGSRAALFRLNILFLPIVIIILLIVILLSIKVQDISNIFPAFQTDFNGYLKGVHTSSLAYVGISIVLFYTAFVESPKKAPQLVTIGMSIPIVIYVLVYLTTVLVFGHSVTNYLLYPTIDLAKRVDFPGGILERIDTLFFAVWTMGVFTTAAMAFDIAILALQSIFKRVKKIHLVLLLSPIIYLMAIIPRNMSQITLFGDMLATLTICFSFLMTILLSIIVKIRGIKSDDKTNP